MRGTSSFLASDQCDEYVQRFHAMFGNYVNGVNPIRMLPTPTNRATTASNATATSLDAAPLSYEDRPIYTTYGDTYDDIVDSSEDERDEQEERYAAINPAASTSGSSHDIASLTSVSEEVEEEDNIESETSLYSTTVTTTYPSTSVTQEKEDLPAMVVPDVVVGDVIGGSGFGVNETDPANI